MALVVQPPFHSLSRHLTCVKLGSRELYISNWPGPRRCWREVASLDPVRLLKLSLSGQCYTDVAGWSIFIVYYANAKLRFSSSAKDGSKRQEQPGPFFDVCNSCNSTQLCHVRLQRLNLQPVNGFQLSRFSPGFSQQESTSLIRFCHIRCRKVVGCCRQMSISNDFRFVFPPRVQSLLESKATDCDTWDESEETFRGDDISTHVPSTHETERIFWLLDN